MLKRLLAHLHLLSTGNHHHDVDEELQFHLEQQVHANLAAGMPSNKARHQALIAFGAVEGTREACREQRPSFPPRIPLP